MPMINVDVPVELRTAIKRYALDHDITMRDAVVIALQALTAPSATQPSEKASDSTAPEAPEAPLIGGDTRSAPIQGASFDD